MRREIEKQKELRGEVESKCKWANARLKQELEAHKVSEVNTENGYCIVKLALRHIKSYKIYF